MPRLPLVYLLAGGAAPAPAVIHDWLTQVHPPGIDRSLAAAVFLEAMRLDGTPRWRAWLMWLGVRIGGAGAWAAGPARCQILRIWAGEASKRP